jgi:prevent-host-death family protein
MQLRLRNWLTRQSRQARLNRRTWCDRPVQYNIYDARHHFSELVRRASAGEQIVIARAGVPIARLVALDAVEQTRPGILRGHFVLRDAQS